MRKHGNAIRKTFQTATAADIDQGKLWYPRARWTVYRMAQRYGVPIERAAGVIAVLSQRCRWHKNIEHANACFEGKPIGGLPAAAAKARAIRDGANILETIGPSAYKIHAFYLALIGDDNAIVIDTWILKAFAWPKPGYTRLQYSKLAAIIRREAIRHNLKPAEYQAAVWCAIRGAAD